MCQSGVAIVSSDAAIRAYIRARRKAVKLTQEIFARAIGLPHSTYRDWESGSTQEMKARPFARAAAILHIPMGHMQLLGDPKADPDQAMFLAGDRIPLPPDPELDAVIAEELDWRQNDGHSAQRVRAAHLTEQIIDHPELFDQWLDYGKYLLSKR